MKNALLHILSASLCLLLFVTHHLVTSQDLARPPQRPEVFRNPQELRDYLKSLNEYFAIVGRPRFGRSVSKRSIDDYKRAFSSFQGLDVDGDGIITTSDLAYFSSYISGR